MTREEFLNKRANFAWDFGQSFLIETDDGKCYIWSDPDYQGNHTIQPITMEEWDKQINEAEGGFARDKGEHIIRRYCGNSVILVDVVDQFPPQPMTKKDLISKINKIHGLVMELDTDLDDCEFSLPFLDELSRFHDDIDETISDFLDVIQSKLVH